MSEIKEAAQTGVGTIISLTPVGRIASLTSKIVLSVTVVLVILLIVIAIILFAKQHAVAGIWVLGAGIAIGSFYLYTRRDLCAGSVRMITGEGEFNDGLAPGKPVEKIEDLDTLKPNDWAGLEN
jgi:hypothetical protein